MVERVDVYTTDAVLGVSPELVKYKGFVRLSKDIYSRNVPPNVGDQLEDEIRVKAADMGANAIIGFKIETCGAKSGNTRFDRESWFKSTMYGTAVYVEKAPTALSMSNILKVCKHSSNQLS